MWLVRQLSEKTFFVLFLLIFFRKVSIITDPILDDKYTYFILYTWKYFQVFWAKNNSTNNNLNYKALKY